ncbi:MAG: DUF4340 domain-containing protein [Spirulinaceae cyanobacterium]
MKLTRKTWILISLAGVLGVGVYLYESQLAPRQEAVEEKRKQIFAFTEEEVKTLVVELPDQTLEFERTNQEITPWQMKQPEDTPANSAVVAFLLDALAEEERDRTFSVPVQQLKNYGLDEPISKISVTLESEEKHQLFLGQSATGGKLIYAQADPSDNPGKESEVILVPINFQYAVERDLSEWKDNQ